MNSVFVLRYNSRRRGQHGIAEMIISPEGAARRLTGYTTDVPGALARLRANPYARLHCEGGDVYARPAGAVKSTD